MTVHAAREPIQIKKYPNRRYYDATRSRHVTLQEVYELVREGHDIVVTDSRNNEDLTNLVLLQMILERDQPKLDLFPSSILHMMIRSNHQVLRVTLERFFGPFMSMVADSQKQFDAYLRQAMQGAAMSPFQWANSMMQAFTPSARGQAMPPDEPIEPAAVNENGDISGMLDELRGQIESLTRRVDELRQQRGSEPSRPAASYGSPVRRKPLPPDEQRNPQPGD